MIHIMRMKQHCYFHVSSRESPCYVCSLFCLSISGIPSESTSTSTQWVARETKKRARIEISRNGKGRTREKNVVVGKINSAQMTIKNERGKNPAKKNTGRSQGELAMSKLKSPSNWLTKWKSILLIGQTLKQPGDRPWGARGVGR